MTRLVAALGGNALARRGEPISVDVQRHNAASAAVSLAPLAERFELVVTHGNGPQVGLLLLESEADGSVPAYPLDVLGAESEGMIGYLLEQALRGELPGCEVATLLTQTVVDRDDPAFRKPTKPIGPVYSRREADRLARDRGFALRADGDGFRRVVASPEPLRILEEQALLALLDGGVLPICAGGGGVPVIMVAGRPEGVEAVVDKDLTAVLLARLVGAEVLLLLTDVDGVYADFARPSARLLDALSPAQARELVACGDVPAGSMGPKLEAAARFAETGGTAVICALDAALAAVDGMGGTRVTASGAPAVPAGLVAVPQADQPRR